MLQTSDVALITVLTAIDGIDFETAWAHRTVEGIDTATDLTVPYISAEDLITNKTASAREQDLADVAAIRKARED